MFHRERDWSPLGHAAHPSDAHTRVDDTPVTAAQLCDVFAERRWGCTILFLAGLAVTMDPYPHEVNLFSHFFDVRNTLKIRKQSQRTWSLCKLLTSTLQLKEKSKDSAI